MFDEISLGEIMLRLDPGAGRIKNSRSFTAWEGGGEYNVARGLRRCFGLRTAVITALADNEVGRLIEDFILQGGVDTSFIKWMSYDGIGRNVRNGLNFTERGYGIRGAVGVSDRGNTAASQLEPRMLIGTISSVSSASAGCTRAEFLPLCPRRARRPLSPQSKRRRNTAPLSPMTSTTVRRSKGIGGREGAAGQPRNSQIYRCHDRQRGGFHRLPRS